MARWDTCDMTNTPGEPPQEPPGWQPQWQPSYTPPPPPPVYGAGYQPYPYVAQAPAHPQATTAMVLGIVGLASVVAACGLGLVVSPFAWVFGRKAVREIDASGGAYSGRGAAKAGFVMGVIGTVLLILGLLAIVALVTVGMSGGFDEGTTFEQTNAL